MNKKHSRHQPDNSLNKHTYNTLIILTELQVYVELRFHVSHTYNIVPFEPVKDRPLTQNITIPSSTPLAPPFSITLYIPSQCNSSRTSGSIWTTASVCAVSPCHAPPPLPASPQPLHNTTHSRPSLDGRLLTMTSPSTMTTASAHTAPR